MEALAISSLKLPSRTPSLSNSFFPTLALSSQLSLTSINYTLFIAVSQTTLFYSLSYRLYYSYIHLFHIICLSPGYSSSSTLFIAQLSQLLSLSLSNYISPSLSISTGKQSRRLYLQTINWAILVMLSMSAY